MNVGILNLGILNLGIVRLFVWGAVRFCVDVVAQPTKFVER